MTNRKFYIAFFILTALVILTIVVFGFVVSLPMWQKYLDAKNNEPKIILEKPQFNSSNPILGPQNAKIKIIEFGDFLCPYCKISSPEIKRFVADHPKEAQLVWKNFPNIETHPTAAIVAAAAQCANEQNSFWEYHDLIFENQESLAGDNAGPLLLTFADNLGLDKFLFAKCLSSKKTFDQIGIDFEEGRALGINGTPYLFINNTIKLDGVVKYEELEEYLQ